MLNVLRYTVLPIKCPTCSQSGQHCLWYQDLFLMTTKSQLWFNPAGLLSPLVLLSLPQCLCLGRHSWRKDKSSLVHLSISFCHTTLLHKQFVTTTTTISVCYCHAAAIPHHLPKQGALWNSSWHCFQHVSGMDAPRISTDLSMVKLCVHQLIFVEL